MRPVLDVSGPLPPLSDLFVPVQCTSPRVLVVDADPGQRAALLASLSGSVGIDSDMDAAAPAEAGQRLLHERIDAVILHVSDPGETCRRLRDVADAAILVLVDPRNPTAVVAAWEAGAAAVIPMDEGGLHLEILPHALRRTLADRHARTSVAASETGFTGLMDAIPSAVFICDAEGLITCFNRRTRELWGREPRLRDPADRFCASVGLYEPDGTRVLREDCWRALTQKTGGVAKSEMIVDFGGGNRRHVLAYANPIHGPDGSLRGAINIWVDVSEMRQLEHRQRLLDAQLAHAQRLEAVGTLASGVAHDFNNHLATIMGILQLAELDLPPSHELRGLLQEALAATRRGRDVVQRLQAFCREAQGELEARRLDGVIEEALELVRPALPRHLTLETRIAPACPPVLCCAGDLHEMLRELIANAAQAIDRAPGTITVTLEHIMPGPEFYARYPQVGPRQTICISVGDTGPGMSETTRARLFDPFFTTREPGQGTGLGMAAVYGIVKRHEGSIVVDSSDGAGTIIRVFLPPSHARGAGRPATPVRPPLTPPQEPISPAVRHDAA